MELRGVKFGDLNTAELNLILNEKAIKPPTPKTYYVSVDGRDGDVDMSEALNGEIKYNNTEASFKFLMTKGTPIERVDLMEDIVQRLHGQKLKIVLPDDSEHYLMGRVSIIETKATAALTEFKVSANCEPWKYSNVETVITKTATAAGINVTCTNNGRKTVIPELTVKGSVVVEFGNVKTSLSDGTFKILGIKFETGSHTLKISGTGTITIKYREALLIV